MVTNFGTNPNFKCPCKKTIGTCSNIDHPKKMEWLVGPFVEGWSLGKYSRKKKEDSSENDLHYGHRKYGQLINKYKYQAPNLPVAEMNDLRQAVMNKINSEVENFILGYFPRYLREFDTVIAVPSKTGKRETIQNSICEYLGMRGFKNLTGILVINEFSNTATKNIELKLRSQNLDNVFKLIDKDRLKVSRGILLVDDVYESGATLKKCVGLIDKEVPLIKKFFLTVAYLD